MSQVTKIAVSILSEKPLHPCCHCSIASFRFPRYTYTRHGWRLQADGVFSAIFKALLISSVETGSTGKSLIANLCSAKRLKLIAAASVIFSLNAVFVPPSYPPH